MRNDKKDRPAALEDLRSFVKRRHPHEPEADVDRLKRKLPRMAHDEGRNQVSLDDLLSKGTSCLGGSKYVQSLSFVEGTPVAKHDIPEPYLIPVQNMYGTQSPPIIFND